MHTTWADKKHEIARPVYGRKHIVDNGNERRNHRRMNNHILWQYTVDDHSIPLTITLSLTTIQAWTDDTKLWCTTSLAALYWRTYWNVITTQVIPNDKAALWLSIEPWFDLVRPILTTIVQFLVTSAFVWWHKKSQKNYKISEPTFDQLNADDITSSVRKRYAYVVEEELSFPTLPWTLYESYVMKIYEAVGGAKLPPHTQ
jgi:hypothetical protein